MADTATSKRTRVAVTISKDSMTASILLRAPQDGDGPITFEEVMEELKANNVAFGIDQDAIREAVANSTFNTPLKVASGRMPERGANSTFVYNFDTSAQHVPKEGPDGHIDYKDIDFIQNVEKGAVLATRVPATAGRPGVNVRGKEIKGPDGRDVPFNNGVNTEVSSDGLSLSATASGAIQFQYGKVSVMDIITIKGDVDHTVGNVDCRGSLRVSGSIKAGFKITVDGDLEVGGNIEDAEIHAKGNIMVKGGFFGEGGGIMEAGGDITVKYAEGQRLVAGNEIQVGGEIVNCRVEAGERVVVKGRRGKIIGGTVRARCEIRAAVLGSEAGTHTELQVAYDPELIRQYYEATRESQRIQGDQARIKDALYVLYRLQMENKLSPDKKAALVKLEQFQKEAPENLEALKKRMAEIEEELRKHHDAVIICEEKLYPGVKAAFGIVYREMLEENGRCKLNLEAGKVLISDFRGA
ncbi:MAG: FapA family protein [Candidatus Zixiibacteriota bacterium]